MKPDYIQVYKVPGTPKQGVKKWQVEALQERMFDDEVLTGWQFDDREAAVEHARREAEHHGIDLIVEGQRVAGVRHVDDWRGNEWQEFGL